MKRTAIFKVFILLGLSTLGLQLKSQVLGPTLLSTASQSATVSGTTLTYNIGDFIVTTTKKPNYTLTQGFNQPPFLVVNGIVNPMPNQLKLSAYPNPTIDQLTLTILKTGSGLNDAYMIQVFDLNGKCIVSNAQTNFQNNTPTNTIHFDTSTLAAGQYLLKVTNLTAKQTATVKITKL